MKDAPESRRGTDPSAPPRAAEHPAAVHDNVPDPPGKPGPAVEIGGRAGPDPTRFGDWEKNGRCIDF